MEELSQILNSLEKAAPSSERLLVQDYFTKLAGCCGLADRQTLLKAASDLPENLSLWAGVTDILKKLEENPLKYEFVPIHIREEIENSIKKFSKLAQRRATRINRISTHIMDSKIQRLCFRLSKISLKELSEILQDLWVNFRAKNLPHLDIPDEILGIQFARENTYILLNTIQNIHYALAVSNPHTNLNDPWATDIPTLFFRIFDHVPPGRLKAFRFRLDALEVMAYIHHVEQTKLTPLTIVELFPFHDFVHCSKCWRLVPRMRDNQNMENKKHRKSLLAVYCDEHSPIKIGDHTLTEYHKAIKLPCNNKKEGLSPSWSPKFFEIMRHFPSITPTDPAGLSAQDWYDARVSPLEELDLTKYPKIEFDLDWIWELCPNVLRYIQKEGGIPNLPESILEKLDPFTEKEKLLGMDLRKKLHELLAKNFGLYFQEIAMAETFLSEYNAQWDGRTHGGSRRKK